MILACCPQPSRRGEIPLSKQQIYLAELAQAWIDEKKAQGRALRWLREWASVLQKNFFPALCRHPAHTITQADVMAVIGAHYSEVSQTTRNRYIGYLKAILEYGVEHGHLHSNPLAKWKKGKEPRRQSRLTLEDMKKIQQAAPAHLAWALEVAWHIPTRPGASDLFALRFDRHVKYDREGVEVYHSKVGRWAFVQCPPHFMRALALRETQHKSGYLIEYKGKPVKRMDTALETAANRAGVTYAVCMYDVRHLWVTTALDRGLEPSAIAYLAGIILHELLEF